MVAEVDGEVLEEIARRRTAGILAEREDVLSLLLQARDEGGEPLSDAELRDEKLVTLLVAGHEATATLLAWALQELADAPALQARLAAGRNGLAEPVVTETLRLHPPVPLGALRRLRSPLRIAGHDLPAGATWPRAHCSCTGAPISTSTRTSSRPTASSMPSLPPGGGCRSAAVSAAVSAPRSPSSRRAWCWPTWPGASCSPGRRGAARSGIGRRGIVLVPRRGARVVARSR